MSEDDADEYQKHLIEVEDTFRRSMRENHTLDNAILELNALKMACNITFHDIRVGLVSSLLQSITADQSQLAVNADKLVTKWCELFQKFASTVEEQLDLLSIIDTAVPKWTNAAKVLHVVLMAFYQNDVVDEDVIIQKRDQLVTSSQSPMDPKFKMVYTAFAEWLESAEAESTSSDGDAESDDDSE